MVVNLWIKNLKGWDQCQDFDEKLADAAAQVQEADWLMVLAAAVEVIIYGYNMVITIWL